MRPITRAFAASIPPTVTSEEGCKKSTAVDKFYTRTAGMFYVFRPCGVRLSHSEMYTCESLSDVMLQLIDIFGEKPDANDLKAIVYDRACDLHPFVRRLSSEGNGIADEYSQMDYIVDKFHVEGHTQDKCNLNSRKCEYHPNLEKIKKYTGMNSEIAEQSFNVLNGYKYTTRKMSYCKRLLFFKFIDDTWNSLKF